jgi:SAM-dependent methyltransferase
MSPRDLPVLSGVSNGEKDVYGSFMNLSGKNVLCIGFSELEIEQLVAKYGPSKITALTNWVGHGDSMVKKFPLVIGDITKRTEFPDNSFDAILTLSVLEHLDDLHSAFDEMTRLSRKNGEMIHVFGPAWSCAYGGHLYAQPNDKLLDFTSWQMPAHMHLLCSHDEIVDYYIQMGYPESAGHVVIHWFYKTPLINRVYYDDYVKIFEEDRFQIDRVEIMWSELPRDHLMRLRNAFPGKRDFSSYGGKYKLIVRK